MVVFRHFVFHYYWNRRLPLFFHKDRQTFPSPSLSVSVSLSPSLSPCQPPSPSPVPVLFWGCDGRSCRLSVIQQSPSGRPRVHPAPTAPPPTPYGVLEGERTPGHAGVEAERWWHRQKVVARRLPVQSSTRALLPLDVAHFLVVFVWISIHHMRVPSSVCLFKATKHLY